MSEPAPDIDAAFFVEPTDPSLRIGNIYIELVAGRPWLVALSRDGEGGHFSLAEFAEVLHRFISERL